VVNTGDKEHPRPRVRDVPALCDDCPEDKTLWGCGWHATTRGKGTVPTEDGETLDTCPQFYLRQPFVLSVYELLRDYDRGSLGNVLDMECSVVDALRVLSAAMGDWEVRQQEAHHG
jgi:hypothetical protein